MSTRLRFYALTILTALALGAAALHSQQPAKAPQSSRPGLNDTWKSPDVDSLVGRLEVESREIYREREKIADIVAGEAGKSRGNRVVIADVGAGSGFMVEEFAKRVGKTGRVIAVDINPKMLERIAARAKELNYPQIETALTREDSVDILENSVDIVFVCDTYHHFEHPQKSLAGIHRALRPGGILYVVDFHRVPGKSPEWMLEHVRGSKEEFIKEIAAAGFTLREDIKLPYLSENYMLRFRRN